MLISALPDRWYSGTIVQQSLLILAWIIQEQNYLCDLLPMPISGTGIHIWRKTLKLSRLSGLDELTLWRRKMDGNKGFLIEFLLEDGGITNSRSWELQVGIR